MNKLRCTVRIVVRTAVLSARLTCCIAIQLIRPATQTVPDYRLPLSATSDGSNAGTPLQMNLRTRTG